MRCVARGAVSDRRAMENSHRNMGDRMIEVRACCVAIGLVMSLLTSGCPGIDRETAASRAQPRNLPTKPDSVILELAVLAANAARAQGFGTRPILTVIDYSLPSVNRRLWVLDLQADTVLFHERVAHGKGSGEYEAETTSCLPTSAREDTYSAVFTLFASLVLHTVLCRTMPSPRPDG